MWKMDGEEKIPEGCWELWGSSQFRPNVIHMINFANDKEVLKRWVALNGDTKNYTYLLHKGNSWFNLSLIDNKFDF